MRVHRADERRSGKERRTGPIRTTQRRRAAPAQQDVVAAATEEVAARWLLELFDLPRDAFESLIEGVEMDVGSRRYETFEELYEYCIRVASAVGLICLHIFGSRGEPLACGVYTAEQRIAASLVRLARKLGEQRQGAVLIQLPFSRQDLAAMTGTTIETVSRVMSHFAAEGLISTGRKWVSVNDLERLQEIVNEAAVN